jgi:ribosomal protein S12 methylthiotransferase
MPIQHINSRILSLMRRGVSRRQIEQLIMRIRKALPDAALRTSVIVGFPSETDREFKELLAFMRDVRFERLGAFVYSREEGTPAYAMRQQISAAKKRARFDALMSLQQDIARQVNARFLGTRMRVLIEECEDGRYVGRSALDAPEVDGNVYVRSSGTLRPGTFIDARITDTLEYDLVGEVAS